MDTRRFGRTDVQLPVIGVGTWAHGGPNIAGELAVGWSDRDDARSRLALVRAHRVGVTHWDTADVYGNGVAERVVGSVWDDVPRDDVFLASKVGWDPGPHDYFYDPKHMRVKLEESLRNLRVETIDLYYLHHCNFGPDGRHLDEAAETIYRFRDEGKIRFVGLSDWSCAAVAQFAPKVDPDAVQVYRNVVDDTYASSGLEEWVGAHDAGVVFFSPLKQGLLLGKYRRPESFETGDVRGRVPEFHDQIAIDTLRAKRDELTRRFADQPEPLLHALIAPLLADTPTASVLVGLRTEDQVDAVSRGDFAITEPHAKWVRDFYSDVTFAPFGRTPD